MKKKGQQLVSQGSEYLKNKLGYAEGGKTEKHIALPDTYSSEERLAEILDQQGYKLERKEITMKDLAEEIIKQVGSKSKIIYRPLPSDDPLTREPDITKAKTKLGWSPKVDRSEGIAKTIEYFKSVI